MTAKSKKTVKAVKGMSNIAKNAARRHVKLDEIFSKLERKKGLSRCGEDQAEEEEQMTGKRVKKIERRQFRYQKKLVEVLQDPITQERILNVLKLSKRAAGFDECIKRNKQKVLEEVFDRPDKDKVDNSKQDLIKKEMASMGDYVQKFRFYAQVDDGEILHISSVGSINSTTHYMNNVVSISWGNSLQTMHYHQLFAAGKTIKIVHLDQEMHPCRCFYLRDYSVEHEISSLDACSSEISIDAVYISPRSIEMHWEDDSENHTFILHKRRPLRSQFRIRTKIDRIKSKRVKK